MSGGSYDYVFAKVDNECNGRMYDYEMNDFIIDFVEVLHKLEWWQSGDLGEEDYRKCLNKFKAKWFNADSRDVRLKGYIDTIFDNAKKDCYNLVGVKAEE